MHCWANEACRTQSPVKRQQSTHQLQRKAAAEGEAELLPLVGRKVRIRGGRGVIQRELDPDPDEEDLPY